MTLYISATLQLGKEEYQVIVLCNDPKQADYFKSLYPDAVIHQFSFDLKRKKDEPAQK